MGENVEKLAAENALVGEGPVWDVESQTLYWIDIQGGKFWNCLLYTSDAADE